MTARVREPSIRDGGEPATDTIAELLRYVPIQFGGLPNAVDAAVAWFEDVLGCSAPLTFGPFGDPTGTFMQDLLGVHPRAVIEQITLVRCGRSANIELFEYEGRLLAMGSPTALKQEVVHVPMPVDNYDEFGMVTSDSDIACYTRPEKGGFLLVGSEDPPCDPREWVDPDDYDRNFSEQWRVQALRAAQRIPALGIPSQMKGIVDLYDVTDDWIPIYDKSCVPGFYMAIGTSGNQFKNAGVAGAMMADLIEKVENGHDHDAEPVRFPLKHIGRTTDVGFYSRLRTINPESSFSVLG
jgi:hypothetical protein